MKSKSKSKDLIQKWWSRRKGSKKFYTPLKDELLSKSLVACNKMVPESTMINPHISDIVLPTLWPSQSYNNDYHQIIALQIGLRRVLMLALATEKTTKISPPKKRRKRKSQLNIRLTKKTAREEFFIHQVSAPGNARFRK